MMPTFIIIGAPRAGTTSLYHYLRQHPQIVMSKIKETNFFAFLASQVETNYQIRSNSKWHATSPPAYEALFESNRNTKAIGEASPLYLYMPSVPNQIYKHIPSVKIILILRNPIERAYSAYLKNRREGFEARSFKEAVMQEIKSPSRVVTSKNFYVRAGFYFEHLQRFLQYFESNQLKIIFQEDLQKNSQLILKSLFEYVQVDNQFIADTSVRFNESLPPMLIKKPSVRQAMKKITSTLRQFIPYKTYFSLLNMKYAINKKLSTYPAPSTDLKIILRDQYQTDINNLQSYVRRDLSSWLVIE